MAVAGRQFDVAGGVGSARSAGSGTPLPAEASCWPQPYLECVRRYNAGEHWQAHEVLEDLWRATGEPERRRFYQGIIQLAAAFVHAERGNLRGVQRLLAKADAKLEAVSSPCLGLDVAALRRAMAAAGREARAAAADPRRAFDWRHCKPRLLLRPEAARTS